MAHKLKIAGAEYPEVSKVTFTDTDGNQQSYLAEDEVYTAPQVQMLAELEDGTLRLVDMSAADISAKAPTTGNHVWIEAEGQDERTINGGIAVSATQPQNTKIWVQTEE